MQVPLSRITYTSSCTKRQLQKNKTYLHRHFELIIRQHLNHCGYNVDIASPDLRLGSQYGKSVDVFLAFTILKACK